MNFKEQKEKILTDGYKYAELYCGSEKITARNNAGKIEEKLNEIGIDLKNNPPGLYEIRAYNSTVKTIKPTVFIVDTRTNLSEDQKRQPIVIKEPMTDKLLENQKIFDLTLENARLTMEIEKLRGEITDLERELLEMEAEQVQIQQLNEPPPPSLMESAKDFLGSLMEFGAPLLDQHFALKKQQLEIERMKLGSRRPGAPAPGKDPNVQIRIIGEWVETFKDQPEIYGALQQISENSQTVEQFMQYLNQFNPEYYAELSKQI
jgi:hypothetical protein